MTKQEAHMAVAEIQALQSHATRLQVGAVLVKDDREIGTGRNGCVSDGSNECEFEYFNVEENRLELITKPEVIHAEANVILFAAKHGNPTNGCELYTTHSPCYECCKMIVQCGIIKVTYKEEYRDRSGLDFLEENGVEVIEL